MLARLAAHLATQHAQGGFSQQNELTTLMVNVPYCLVTLPYNSFTRFQCQGSQGHVDYNSWAHLITCLIACMRRGISAMCESPSQSLHNAGS